MVRFPPSQNRTIRFAHSGNALKASNASNYRIWRVPAVLSRGIPGNTLRAFPGSFRNFSGISSGKSQPYGGMAQSILVVAVTVASRGSEAGLQRSKSWLQTRVCRGPLVAELQAIRLIILPLRGHGNPPLVAQCSATPATVAATPPCSATSFQTTKFRCDTSREWGGGRCDTRIFRGCGATPLLHLQNALKSRKSAATRHG